MANKKTGTSRETPEPRDVFLLAVTPQECTEENVYLCVCVTILNSRETLCLISN